MYIYIYIYIHIYIHIYIQISSGEPRTSGHDGARHGRCVDHLLRRVNYHVLFSIYIYTSAPPQVGVGEPLKAP